MIIPEKLLTLLEVDNCSFFWYSAMAFLAINIALLHYG